MSDGHSVEAMQADLDALLDYIGGQLDTLDGSAIAEETSTDHEEPVTGSNGTNGQATEEDEDLIAFERLSCVATEAILVENELLLNQTDDRFNEDIDSDTLPVRVQACMSFLEERALTTEGIFRKCGLKNRVRALHEKLPQIADDTCVHDAADWLKAWTRAVGPLLSPALLRSLLNTPYDIRKWRALMLLEHGIRRDGKHPMLQRLLLFLHKFSSFGDVSGMNARNLSICWAPALLPSGGGGDGPATTPTELTQSFAAQLADARSLLQTLIEKAPQLFSAPRPSSGQQGVDALTANAKQLVPAAPQDILARLLYQRHRWDPLVAEWRILPKDKSEEKQPDSSDTLSLVVVAPSGERRNLKLERTWSAAEGQLLLKEQVIEDGAEYLSTWSMRPSVRDAKSSVNVSIKVTNGGEGLILLGGRTRSQLVAALERLAERQLANVLQSFELPAINGAVIRV